MTETAEYVEQRDGPGKPETWSYHWWQQEPRAPIYRACQHWGRVVRWRGNEHSGGAPFPPTHRADDEVKVEIADGVFRWVFVKYLPQRTTTPKSGLHPLAPAYVWVESLAIEAAGEDAAHIVRRCLSRQFVEGRGRVVQTTDPVGHRALMLAFVRLGQERVEAIRKAAR